MADCLVSRVHLVVPATQSFGPKQNSLQFKNESKMCFRINKGLGPEPLWMGTSRIMDFVIAPTTT